MRTRRVQYPTRDCSVCGNAYEPIRIDQKYCRRQCFAKVELAKRRAKYASDDEFREIRKADTKKWKQNNPERARELARDAYQKLDRDVVSQYNSRHYQKHKERITARNKSYYARVKKTAPWRMSLNAARHRSKRLGLPFDLTAQWAIERWTGACELCRLPFEAGKGKWKNPFAASIDRIDSTLGYTQKNCRFILLALNTFKSDGDDATMYRIAEALITIFHKD